jgi:hypothetical protein
MKIESHLHGDMQERCKCALLTWHLQRMLGKATSEIPCRVSNIARGGGDTVSYDRLKSVEPTRRDMQVRHGQYRG